MKHRQQTQKQYGDVYDSLTRREEVSTETDAAWVNQPLSEPNRNEKEEAHGGGLVVE